MKHWIFWSQVIPDVPPHFISKNSYIASLFCVFFCTDRIDRIYEDWIGSTADMSTCLVEAA